MNDEYLNLEGNMIKPKSRKSPPPPPPTIPSANTALPLRQYKKWVRCRQVLRHALLWYYTHCLSTVVHGHIEDFWLIFVPNTKHRTNQLITMKIGVSSIISSLLSTISLPFILQPSLEIIHTLPVLDLTLLIPFALLRFFWSWTTAEKAKRLGAGVLKKRVMS